MGSHNATWEVHGYCGAGNVHSLINCYVAHSAIVVGSGKGVFEELKLAKSKVDDPIIIAANDVGMFISDLDHWVSLHGTLFPGWETVRWYRSVNQDKAVKTHTCNHDDGADFHWSQLTPQFALSGYFAMQIALIMGCSPIILAGCPGDATPRFFESETPGPFKYGGGSTTGDKGVRLQILDEVKRVPLLKERVRAMSGFNKELFGAP